VFSFGTLRIDEACVSCVGGILYKSRMYSVSDVVTVSQIFVIVPVEGYGNW
jgi:hypothetical protein